MIPDVEPCANRLGALALRLTDRIALAVTNDGERSLTAATALCVLDRWFASPPNVDVLRTILGLTPSGGVRLVDVLEEDGLATRHRADDKRVRVVALTPAGRRVARTSVEARQRLLRELIATLDAVDREALARIVDALLTALVVAPKPAQSMCRLCDTEACGAARGHPCPITVAALGIG